VAKCRSTNRQVMIMNDLRKKIFGLFLILISVNLYAEQSQEEVEPFSKGELEQILAPIALYPDTVLSHILVAATYPLEVIQAERWTKKNTDLKGSDAVEAVDEQDWDPSVKALVAFPQVLQRLSENLEWTQKLGDAFLQDEAKLLASVQSLRQRAYESGNLEKMDKVTVTHEDSSIVIEPIEREVVYVPYYDTRVVYGPWYWSHYPPVYWSYPRYSNHHSPFYWGPRIHVSFGFFFSSFHWHNHHIVRIPRRHYRPHHYYDRHQIVHHQHANRWYHNPTHRRGVSYRSVSVRNRYNSTRASQTEIREYRSNQRNTNSRRERNSEVVPRNNSRSNERRENTRLNKENARITSSNRIRQELSDGRISIKERNARPENRNNSERNNTPGRSEENRSNSPRQNDNRIKDNRIRSENRDRTREPNKIDKKPKNSEPIDNGSRENRNSGKQSQPKHRDSRNKKDDNRSSYSPRPSRSSSKDSSSRRSSNRDNSSNRASNSNRGGRSKGRDNG